MKNYIDQFIYSPWKGFNELLMYLLKPFVYLYLKINGVDIGKNFKFYGMPKIYRTKNSKITIGNNFEGRSWWWSNPLGINHPLIICTWSKNAVIRIGNDVGVSGGSIVAAEEINIGDRTLIGTNTTIIDTDFHPTQGAKRYTKTNVKTGKIVIGSDVFLGMNTQILKNIHIENNMVIPAGSILR